MHNKVALVHGGKKYFDLLEHIISQAHTIIHLQVYIFNDDETGDLIINALLRAAERGVREDKATGGETPNHPAASVRRRSRKSFPVTMAALRRGNNP